MAFINKSDLTKIVESIKQSVPQTTGVSAPATPVAQTTQQIPATTPATTQDVGNIIKQAFSQPAITGAGTSTPNALETDVATPEEESLISSLLNEYNAYLGSGVETTFGNTGNLGDVFGNYLTNLQKQYGYTQEQLAPLRNEYSNLVNMIAGQTGDTTKVLGDLRETLAQRAGYLKNLNEQANKAQVEAVTDYNTMIQRVAPEFTTTEGFIAPEALATAEQMRRPTAEAALNVANLRDILLGQYGEDVQRGLEAYLNEIKANQLRAEANLAQQQQIGNDLSNWQAIYSQVPELAQTLRQSQLQDIQNALTIQEATQGLTGDTSVLDPFSDFVENPQGVLLGTEVPIVKSKLDMGIVDTAFDALKDPNKPSTIPVTEFAKTTFKNLLQKALNETITEGESSTLKAMATRYNIDLNNFLTKTATIDDINTWYNTAKASGKYTTSQLDQARERYITLLAQQDVTKKQAQADIAQIQAEKLAERNSIKLQIDALRNQRSKTTDPKQNQKYTDEINKLKVQLVGLGETDPKYIS